jgi:acyl carrier protein
MNDARTAIRAIVSSYGKLSVDLEAVGDDGDLVELGLTSHATVNVMLALEEEFDFEFPDELLTKETFESVSAMLGVISTLVPS